jgi:choline dehydrogenase-like flavoprotein
MPSPMSHADVLSSVDALVVGGGFAGVAAARRLGYGGVQVLLVDAKPYFEYTPAALRSMVHPPAIDSSTVMHENRLPNVQFVHGCVVDVQRGRAVIARQPDDGRHGKCLNVNFKVCIWAGGTHYVPPIRPSPSSSFCSRSARRLELLASLDKMQKAEKSVVG